MKSYDVKFEPYQEVYVLESKTISKNRIHKIRIIDSGAHQYADETGKVKDTDGIEIEYLIFVKVDEHSARGEWYKQEDLFLTKEELIETIK